MSDLKSKATLREVLIEATPVNDADDLDALFGDVMLKEKAIAKITNMHLDKPNHVDEFVIETFGDDWLEESVKSIDTEDTALGLNRLKEENDRQDLQEKLQKELDALRSQHEFECEYVDQLEQEIISINNDRDRQIQELTAQLDALQQQLQEQLQEQPKKQQSLEPTKSNPSDDRDLSDRLAIHVLQLEEEFKHRLAIALEIETQKIAAQYLQEISKRDAAIHQLQNDNTALEISQQNLTEELENTHRLLEESIKTIELNQSKLTEVIADRDQIERDQIEEKMIQHLANQAKLHQSLSGLDNEYVSDLRRLQYSEQQIEELQEQVLRQASKTSEYEAAIQHWKEQSVRHQHHALQLSAALERLLVEKPLKHLTETSIQRQNEIQNEEQYLSGRSPESTSPSNLETNPVRSFRPNSKVDLPAFLVRNR